MLAPSLDRERRRPVWDVLSELFLDTELQPDDHQRIARVLAASRYTQTQLEQILAREVGPVLWPNFLAVAGVWDGFDLDWLEAQIVRNARRRLWFRLPGAAVLRMVRHDWMRISALLNASESDDRRDGHP